MHLLFILLFTNLQPLQSLSSSYAPLLSPPSRSFHNQLRYADFAGQQVSSTSCSTVCLVCTCNAVHASHSRRIVRTTLVHANQPSVPMHCARLACWVVEL
jgi:hypothetical protein